MILGKLLFYIKNLIFFEHLNNKFGGLLTYLDRDLDKEAIKSDLNNWLISTSIDNNFKLNHKYLCTSIYLSIRFYNSCRCLPEPKRHSSLFLHYGRGSLNRNKKEGNVKRNTRKLYFCIYASKFRNELTPCS
jgi:hypothetical protein